LTGRRRRLKPTSRVRSLERLAMQIYIYINGQQVGPYGVDQIRQSLSTNQISGDTSAWYEGLADWTTVSAILSSTGPVHSSPTVPQLGSGANPDVECRNRRAFGGIFDLFFLPVSLLPALLILGWLFPRFPATGWLAWLLCAPVVACFLSSRCQATPGMMLFGVIATDPVGGRLGFLKAFIRHIVSMVSLFFLLGYLVWNFNPRRQTLHDKAVDSLIIRKPKGFSAGKLPWLLTCSLFVPSIMLSIILLGFTPVGKSLASENSAPSSAKASHPPVTSSTTLTGGAHPAATLPAPSSASPLASAQSVSTQGNSQTLIATNSPPAVDATTNAAPDTPPSAAALASSASTQDSPPASPATNSSPTGDATTNASAQATPTTNETASSPPPVPVADTSQSMDSTQPPIDNNIIGVKGGTLNFDNTVKIGPAIEGCSYLKQVTWKSFVTNQGRRVVEADAVVNLDAYKDSDLGDGTKLSADWVDALKAVPGLEIDYSAQFDLSQTDATITLAYSGYEFKGRNAQTDKPFDQEIKDTNDLKSIKSIFASNPDPQIEAVIIALSQSKTQAKPPQTSP
jgi:uncharacterized RDD family membrane protein YckC